ncbi:MAG: tetratricopeptide repeat protein [bacterium]|nr:MAG: tetratricopeptide repeat protein [bacterium]
MKRIRVAVLMMVLLTGVVQAARAQEGSGGTRSIFSVGAGSRAIAMGGAFSAIGNDPAVLYYNPAALRLNQYPAIMANHIPLFSGFSDASYDFVGMVYPTLSTGSIGIGVMTVGVGGIRRYEEENPALDLGEISYRESQVILGYAFDYPWWNFLGRLTFGSSVKVLSQRVGDFSDTGTGLDVGLLYRPPVLKGVILGLNLQDIVGAETKLVSESEKVDRTIMFGAGYFHLFGNSSALTLALQFDVPERADNDLRAGVEYRYRDMLHVRVGYDSEQITGGVGFAWHGFQVDYGYFSREEAGSSHPISLSARIGSSIQERIRVRDERRAQEEDTRLQSLFADRISSHIRAADVYRSEGELERALDELKIVLEYDPTNTAAAETLSVVRDAILDEQERRTKDAEKSLLINQHFNLGLKYYSSNEYLLARAEWQNVLDLDPTNGQALEYLARTEEKLSERIEQHRRRARELERGGRHADALGEWNIVLVIDPESEVARGAIERISGYLENLGRDYATASTRLEVIELFEKAVGAFGAGRYAEAVGFLNELLTRQPDHEEGRKLLRRAERRITPLTDEEKEEIRRLYIAGMKYFSQNDYVAAIEEWKKILQIDPDNESVMKNIEEAEIRLQKIGSPEAE